MSNERPENPNSTLTEGLKRKRGRPKKQPQVREHHPRRLPEDAVAVAQWNLQAALGNCLLTRTKRGEVFSDKCWGYPGQQQDLHSGKSQLLASEVPPMRQAVTVQPGHVRGADQVSVLVWRLSHVVTLCFCTSNWIEQARSPSPEFLELTHFPSPKDKEVGILLIIF